MDFTYEKYVVIREIVEKKMWQTYGYSQHYIINVEPVVLTTYDFRDGTFSTNSPSVCYYGTVTVGHFDSGGEHYILYLNGEKIWSIDVQNKLVGTTYTDLMWNEYYVEFGYPITFVGYKFTLDTTPL